MEVKEMNLEQVEARLSEIKASLESEENLETLKALEEEVRALKEQRDNLQAIEARKKAMEDVAKGVGTEKRNFTEEQKGKKTMDYTARSAEYKSAWLKKLAGNVNGAPMFGELTEEETRAFTFVTTNTSAVVPTVILERIEDLLNNDAPIYEDAQKMSIAYGAELPRVKAIVAGDAAVTAEGQPNADEEDTFDSLPLVGVEIKKHIRMSRQMQFQSIDAFEEWVVGHLARRIAVAKESYIISQLADATYGIATENQLTATTLTAAELRTAMGLLRGNGARKIYANSKTIWGTIAGLVDNSGNALFMPSSMDTPFDGRVYGAEVRRDDNLADNVVYIGIPTQIIANEAIAFDVTPQLATDGSLARLFVGYSLFAAGLTDPKGFVKLTLGE